ncbi:outer membrane beta-barrel family protein [Nonlabens ponticola]|uniref:TonB-dependent receptor n=1 Tax=Nonlabens ponticola TaxID=2496866 RepID=A0A3S9MZB5_9FLAO|nr:outer membrane beta-barrel family protein [Nonlabens ponticola]AZQ44520.1 TonB-dependent receptor [Nonlabens ponticola]
MKIIISSVFLLVCLNSLAQKPVEIKGKVIEETTGAPLEFATVSFASNDPDVSPQGGITDIDGNYQFLVTPGTYTVKWEFISFKSKSQENVIINADRDFGITTLAQDIATLDATVVIAEKTTVDLRLDKKIYNIGKDLTVRGGTASDVLDNVPSVSVDVEGNVALRGNDNVRILIDGRPSALVGFNGAEALRQIPSEAIEKIEVITSPSARYDAEGTAGILNIILRKNRLQGFNGVLNLNAGYPEQYGASINANYRTQNWNFFSNTGYNYRTSPGNASSQTEFFNGTSENVFINEQRDFDRLGRNYFTSLGAEYFIDDSSSIIGNIVYRLGNDDDVTTNNIQRFAADRSLNEATFREEQEGEDEDSFQISFDYQNELDDNGQKLQASIQYSTDLEEKVSNIFERETTTNTINDVEFVFEEQDEREALIQVDWEKPVGENIQYEAGYRGNYRQISNSFFLSEIPQDSLPNGALVPDAGLNNTFVYEEFVNAAYGQYGQEFGDFSVLAGLRFEQTNINIDQETTNVTDTKEYSSLFPTLNLGYEFQEGENITLGYNRRISRPRGRSLNPFPSRSSESNIFQGNIDLDPTFSNAVDLGYLRRWKKLTLSTSIYYNRSDDNVERIQQEVLNDDGTAALTDNGDQIIRRFPVNLSTQDRLGYELTLTYRPFDWWTINADANVFRVTTDGDFDGQNFDFENTTYFARLNQKFELPFKTDFQARIFYRGASEDAQGTQNGIATVNLAASKDIINDKASITFNVSDLFNSRRRESTTITPNFIQDSEFQWRERQFTVAFIYRFNQKKQRERGDRRGDGDDDFEFEG